MKYIKYRSAYFYYLLKLLNDLRLAIGRTNSLQQSLHTFKGVQDNPYKSWGSRYHDGVEWRLYVPFKEITWRNGLNVITSQSCRLLVTYDQLNRKVWVFKNSIFVRFINRLNEIIKNASKLSYSYNGSYFIEKLLKKLLDTLKTAETSRNIGLLFCNILRVFKQFTIVA